MSFFRSIIKLQVNIAKGETIINYDDQTTRRITRRNYGFAYGSPAFNGQNLMTDSVKLAEEVTERQIDLTCGNGSKEVELSNAQGNIEALKSDLVADSETNIDVLVDKTKKFNMSYSSDTESESVNCEAECELKEHSEIIADDETVVQLFFKKLSDSCEVSCYKQPTSGRISLAVIQAILPGLISTDIAKEVEDGDQLVEPFSCAQKRLVTWHLSTCSLQDCKGVPVCNCLNIKEKITELREMLHVFLAPAVTFGRMVDRQQFLIEFVQSFHNINELLQVLFEMLAHHILRNANWDAVVQYQPMNN